MWNNITTNINFIYHSAPLDGYDYYITFNKVDVGEDLSSLERSAEAIAHHENDETGINYNAVWDNVDIYIYTGYISSEDIDCIDWSENGNPDEQIAVLAHEIGHALKLGHPYFYLEPNETPPTYTLYNEHKKYPSIMHETDAAEYEFAYATTNFDKMALLDMLNEIN